MKTVIAQQGDTLDALCWRHLGQTRGVVEQALELNRDLAELGPILPLGTVVIVPEPVAYAAPTQPLVQLWQ